MRIHSNHGRTVIPAALREQLNIKDGQLTAPRAAQLRKAQACCQSHIPKKSPPLADELINQHRAEASRPTRETP